MQSNFLSTNAVKNILKTLQIVLFVLMQISCTSTATQSLGRQATQPLDKSQVWQLVQVQGRDIKSSPTPVTIIFNPETSTLHGQAQCNTYTADYSLHDSRLIISNLQPSNTQCPEADMNAENRYLATLRKCTNITVTATTLSLGNKNKSLLEFELQ